MAGRSSEEWLAIFDEAERSLSIAPKEDEVKSIESIAFASAIDHTLLKPEATAVQIDRLCDEATKYKFKVSCRLTSDLYMCIDVKQTCMIYRVRILLSTFCNSPSV